MQMTIHGTARPSPHTKRLSLERLENRELMVRLLSDLKTDRPITARYSPGHTDVAFANFRAPDIERALAAQSSGRMQKAADGR